MAVRLLIPKVTLEGSVIEAYRTYTLIPYSVSAILQRNVTALAEVTGLQLYSDILLTCKLEPYQYCKNNRLNSYAVKSFAPSNLHSVYELLNGKFILRTDWQLTGNTLIFLNKPKGNLLLIPLGSLTTYFNTSEIQTMPIWVAALDEAYYQNIVLQGYELSFSGDGPWLDRVSLPTLPVKVYVKKPAPENTQFTDLTLSFEVY